MAAIIQFRRDTAANWTSNNPTLAIGEVGYETDGDGNYKIGDGSTAWTSLSYGGLGDIHRTLIDAKGDLIVGTADDTAGRLAVGSNGQMLVADSSAAGGVSWAANDTLVNWHEAVELSTTAVLPNSPTYSNGSSGVGATLTAGANARLVVDGANATAGDRVLIQDQASALQNGIYDVTTQGASGSAAWVLTRSDDFDGTPTGQIKQGEAVYALSGTTNGGQGFTVTSTSDPHTVGTHDVAWTQFTGTQAFTAGTSLTISGNTIDHDDSGASAGSYGSATQVTTLTTDAQGHLTAISNTTIAIPSTAVTDFTEAVQDVSGAQLVTNGSHTHLTAAYDDAGDGAIDIALNTTAVAAAAYGSATQVPGYTVDAYGRLTAAANTTIAVPSTAVTDFTEAVQDVSGAQLATNGSHTGITVAYDDAGDGAIDLALISENVQDIVGAQLVTNGTHSGITATYDDAGDGAIDLNVDDFSITLAGDLSGSTTITNLADVTLTATIVADATELGTDTTGNYIATVAGTTNEVEVSGSGSETAAVTIGLPSDVTVTTSLTTPLINVSGASIVLEGATADDFETTLTVTDPTADRTITFPDVDGTVVTTGNLSASTEHIEDTVAAQLVTNGAHSGITATYDDAGDGAIDLNVDDFTITLAGDLGGSATITDLADVTLTATIQANSVALGTDTTGDYTASLVAGTGVTLTNNSGETATPTVAIGQAVGASDTPTFGSVTISSAVANATHAATKAYVDNAIAGLDWHEAVNYASAAALPNTPTYDNGTSGVGATLTAGSQVRLVVDGANATTGNRVLVQDQATGAQNGIYDVTAQGASGSAAWVLTRATDFDGAPTGEIKAGEAIYVLAGSANSGQGFVVTSTSDPHTVGSDAITWTQFTGTQAFSAGTDLTITGNTIDHDSSGVSAAAYGSATQVPGYTVDAQGHLTAAANTTIAIPSTAVTDFTEAVQDVAGAQVATNGSHTGIAASYDDAGDGAVDLTLTASGASAASYGSATQVPGYTVDTYGRLTAASNTTIAIPSTAVTDFTEATQDVAGAQLVTNGSHTHLTATYDDAGDGAIDIALNVTAVTAAAYGSATQVPGYTVDAYGRLTAAANTTIAIPSTAVTDFTEATQDVAGAQVATNGSHTGIGATYDDAGDGAIDLTLTASGVSAASYGSATQVPGYTVDTYGRLTAASDTTIAIPSTAVTDFTEATQDVAGAQLATNGTHTGITAAYDDAGDGAIDLALVTENVQDISGAQLATNGSHTGITATYDDAGDGAIDLALVTENVQDIAGAQLATNGSHTGIDATYDDAGDGAVDLTLTASGVSAASYGSATQVPGYTVDTYGRLTAAADTTIAIPSTAVTDFTEAVQDVSGAQFATNGTHVGLTAAYDDAGDGAVDLTVAATLGTHTSGNYIATVAGTANEIEVSGSGSETAAVTIGLPDDVTVGGILTVSGSIADGAVATTQSQSDASTKLATTAYVDTGLGALSSDSLTDADGDTLIQVEESADEDIIRFDTAGTERMTIAADGTVTITGDLTVNGTETTISSTTITVDDKNIEIGSVATPTDTTADGGGLTLKGATDKTWNWVNSTDAWTSSEHIALATGKSVYVDGVLQLSKNALAATVVLADGVAGTTQAQSNNSTKVATTAYVDTGLGALSSDSLTDADADTKIQVEESADEDIIRFDTAGTERMTIGATGIIATTGTDITLANVASPTDLTADGAGFTLKGAADYTIKWNDVDELTETQNYWESNQNIVATTPAKTSHTDYKDHGLKIGTIGNANSVTYGTATAGSATTITLAAGASAVDDAYNTFKIRIRSGTGVGQERTITDYVGSTLVATVAAWTITPDATSYYVVSSAWNDFSGISTVGQSGNFAEYMMISDGNYTYIGTGNGGNTGLYTWYGNLTARFDYGGVSLGYSGSKFYGRLTTHATGTTKTASYTAALVDESSYIWMNVGSANTFTVPPASSVAFDSGTMMTIIQYGAGQTTITAGSGVTLIATPGLKLRDQNSVCTIVHYTADTWLVYGDLDD